MGRGQPGGCRAVLLGRTNEAMSKISATRQSGVEKRKPRVSPLEFLAQVRAEGEKVTWPTRKETLVTSAMVFVMVVVASAFFLFTDFVLQKLVGLVLGIGG
ncbi:MAG: preprotein translocase subunit SecE [Methylobacteriaceae bacterium]|nr:preprotein translocase subunit SecE [Methylobacteriaceae bacterium]